MSKDIPTIDELRAMSDEDVAALKKKLGKKILMRLALGTLAGVALHLAVNALINRMDDAPVNDEESTED